MPGWSKGISNSSVGQYLLQNLHLLYNLCWFHNDPYSLKSSSRSWVIIWKYYWRIYPCHPPLTTGVSCIHPWSLSAWWSETLVCVSVGVFLWTGRKSLLCFDWLDAFSRSEPWKGMTETSSRSTDAVLHHRSESEAHQRLYFQFNVWRQTKHSRCRDCRTASRSWYIHRRHIVYMYMYVLSHYIMMTHSF